MKLLTNKIMLVKISKKKKIMMTENKESFLQEMWKSILTKVRLMHFLVNSARLSLVNQNLFRSKKYGLDQCLLKEMRRRICQLKQQLF